MKLIRHLQSRPVWQKKVILYTAVGILSLILFFFWLQRATKTFLNFEISKSLKLEFLGQQIKSGFEPLQEGIETFGNILEENKEELQKIEEVLRETGAATE